MAHHLTLQLSHDSAWHLLCLSLNLLTAITGVCIVCQKKKKKKDDVGSVCMWFRRKGILI